MKKTILILLLALTLCAGIPTLAMGWAYTPDPAPEYTVTVSKLDRVNTTAGTAYTTGPDKLAAGIYHLAVASARRRCGAGRILQRAHNG